MEHSKERPIGILMLDSNIPRPAGDIGNKDTFPFPVIHKTVKNATISNVILAKASYEELLQPFLQAAKELQEEGCSAITTSCGFLAAYQEVLAAAVSIPVFTSSLLQIPMAYAMTGRTVGILASSTAVEPLVKNMAQGIPTALKGMDDSVCFAAMKTKHPYYDQSVMKQEVLTAVGALIHEHPEIGSLVIECANLPPYAKAIQDTYGLPVFDIVTLTNFVQNVTHCMTFS